ncbi:MAG: transcriptional regulator, partial [Lachnospiraceae bacterium]|nr:transcriptional regulator [Lachnospiraceae bacterium]
LSEDEEFVLQAQQSYGYKGARDAEELVSDISALFAGGELSENEKDAVMRALQDAYWIAKERNSEKYTPKKYRKESSSSEEAEKVKGE